MVCRNVRIRTDQLQGTRGIETSSSYSKFDGGELKSMHGKSTRGFKCCQKIPDSKVAGYKPASLQTY